jgi:hypothetical protein
MSNINSYKERFYGLMESTMGDVRPILTEGIDYKGVYADVNNGNIRFNKNGQIHTYELEAETPGPNVSVTVNNIFKENGVMKMSFSHTFGSGTSDLGESNLNNIISQIPNDEISFTNKEGKTLILTRIR